MLQQSPAAGAHARKGATVTITVGVLGATTHADDAHHDHATTPTTTTTAAAAAARRLSAAMSAPADPAEALTVAVLAGGRSSEHEVSLSSGAAVRDGLLACGPRGRCGSRSGATGPGDTTASA